MSSRKDSFDLDNSLFSSNPQDTDDNSPLLINEGSSFNQRIIKSDSSSSSSSLPNDIHKSYPTVYSLLDHALDDIKIGKMQHFMLVVTSFGQFIDAVEVSMLSLVFPQLALEWNASDQQLAVVGSLTAVGMMFGATFFGRFSDTFGRKRSYQLSLVVCALFGFVSSFAQNTITFAVMRMLLGVGYGGNMVACTTLLIESIPSNARGVYMSISGVAFGLGAIFIVGLSWALMPSIGWRWILRIAAFLAIPALFMLILVPESVRYYVMKHKFDQAEKAVRNLAKRNGADFPEYFTEENLEHIAAMDVTPHRSHSQDSKRSFLNLKPLRSPKVIKNLAPLVSIWFFNSFASTVFMWVPIEIKRYYKVDSIEYQIAFTLSVGQLFGTAVTLLATLRFRRLVLLKFSTLFTGLFTIFMGLSQSEVGLFVVAFLIQIFETLLISTLYLYSPEVFPTTVRVTCFGICHFFHRTAPIIAPFAIAALSEISFLVTCAVMGSFYLVSFLITWALKVETFNAHMEEEF